MRRPLAICFGLLIALALPAVASAHPLGNFTINHYTGIRVSAGTITLDHVLDMAEIPTFQERQAIDVNADGMIDPGESAAYTATACASTASQLSLSVAGQAQALNVTASGLSFLPGAGGLQTLRLVCEYAAALASPLQAATPITFSDGTYPERIGWREVVVNGDGTSLTGTGLVATSVSDRLTKYPADLLAQPLDDTGVTMTVRPGGPPLAPLIVPDAHPIGAASVPAATVDSSSSSAAVPGGIGGIADQLFALLRSSQLDLPVLLLGMLIAAGLGALHAVQPGHGKTIMAAYLIGSRGNAGQAVLLGVTVTAAHTLNVLLLGGIVLSATSFLPSDRVIPVLGVISALTVVALGMWMLIGQVREARSARGLRASDAHLDVHARAQAHESDHDSSSEHGHEHGLDHLHERGHALPLAEVKTAPAEADAGWHSHGGKGHTHLPAPGQAPLRRRTLVALGLAGGLVPAPEALFILLISIAVGRIAYGVALIVAFGTGMAVVMTAVGLALVYARGWVDRRPSLGRSTQVTRLLPSAAAVVVVVAGLYLTSQALGQARF